MGSDAAASSGRDHFAACRALADPASPMPQAVPARMGL